MIPSTLTRLMETSDDPWMPTGRMTLRLGSALSGTAQGAGCDHVPVRQRGSNRQAANAQEAVPDRGNPAS
jgi:hypothetical protein